MSGAVCFQECWCTCVVSGSGVKKREWTFFHMLFADKFDAWSLFAANQPWTCHTGKYWSPGGGTHFPRVRFWSLTSYLKCLPRFLFSTESQVSSNDACFTFTVMYNIFNWTSSITIAGFTLLYIITISSNSNNIKYNSISVSISIGNYKKKVCIISSLLCLLGDHDVT